MACCFEFRRPGDSGTLLSLPAGDHDESTTHTVPRIPIPTPTSHHDQPIDMCTKVCTVFAVLEPSFVVYLQLQHIVADDAGMATSR